MMVSLKVPMDIVEIALARNIYSVANCFPSKSRAGVRYYQPLAGNVKKCRVLSVEHITKDVMVDTSETLEISLLESLTEIPDFCDCTKIDWGNGSEMTFEEEKK